MARHGVPTADYPVCDSADDGAGCACARSEFGYPLVLKADGLAAGKGVVIAMTRDGAEAAVRAAMVDRRFGDAGERVVLEEFLVGQEASYFVLADGTRLRAAVVGAGSQAHLRRRPRAEYRRHGRVCAEPADHGPISSSRSSTRSCRPCWTAWMHEGHPFRGFLYVGLMLTAVGPEGDRVQRAVWRSRSAGHSADARRRPLVAARRSGNRCAADRCRAFRNEPHVGVVLAAGGYPGDGGNRESRFRVSKPRPQCRVRWCFTRARRSAMDGSSRRGGRVLTVVGRGPTYRDAIDVAYRAASRISSTACSSVATSGGKR